MSATIHYADHRLVLAASGHLAVNVLRHPLTIEGAGLLYKEARRMFDLHQGRYVTISVIEPTAAGSVAPDVREATAQLAREFKILGAAIVIEGSGFRPATTRALVAGMYLINKKQYPHKVCETVTEGAAWLIPFLTEAGLRKTAAEMVAAAESARAALRPTP
jgi:hypothetical protein